ncbi:MAG: hypothetical protein VR69_13090 [Peptococcaceae bacterium BRH_c4b]|nr:MAG: hypothetical protein VR69_13090 [Peptococcaceae bacterium BRH_c4b]
MIDWIKSRCQKLKQVKLYPVAVILLSLLILLICSNHEIIYGSRKDVPYKLLYAVIHEVGIALFILGSITILLELSDFREYFFSRLNDILIKDEYISVLNQDKLRNLENKVQKLLYFKEQQNDKKSFFYKVQNDVKPLINGCYFDYYEIRVECKIEDNLIKKKMTKIFEIVNPNVNEIEESIPIDSSMQIIDGIEDGDLYKVESLSIKSISIDDYGNKTEKDNTIDDLGLIYTKCDDESINKYNIRVQTNKTITVKDRCKVEIIYNTITPMSDPFFTHRVRKPCKRYRCVFHFKNDIYELAGYGFGFMDRNNKITKNNFTGGIELSFKDWILPGDGVIFTLLRR